MAWKNAHLFTLQNFLFDNGAAIPNGPFPDGAVASVFEVEHNEHSFIDPRPTRFARTTIFQESTKDIVVKVPEQLRTGWQDWFSDGGRYEQITLIGIKSNTSGVDEFKPTPNLEFRIQEGFHAFLGPWTDITTGGLVNDQWIAVPDESSEIVFDLKQAYPPNGRAPTASYPYIKVSLRHRGTSIKQATFGGIMLGRRLIPTHNPDAPMVEQFNNLNVQVGRAPGAVLVRRSYNPARVTNASVFIDDLAEHQALVRYLRGHFVDLVPKWATYAARLNWVQAWVKPDAWHATIPGLGSAQLGHLGTSRITTLRKDQWLWDFQFNEIPGVNT